MTDEKISKIDQRVLTGYVDADASGDCHGVCCGGRAVPEDMQCRPIQRGRGPIEHDPRASSLFIRFSASEVQMVFK